MKNKKIIIGGEKIFSFNRFFSSRKNDIFSIYQDAFKEYSLNYTFGGHYSLLAIVDDLIKSCPKGKILVPSYTCKSILTTLKLRKIGYEFYKVSSDLTVDIEDVKLKCENELVSAIIIIDYMGKNQFENIKSDFVAFLKSKDINIIQDCVHSLCLDNYKIYGDYAYNSFRKILPVEGSLLISKRPMEINFAVGTNFKFLFYKRWGQILRSWYVNYNLFSPERFLNYLSRAEEHYNADRIYKLYSFQKNIISRIDLSNFYFKSKIYYNQLLSLFKDSTLEIFRDNSYYPLGFFVVSNKRDELRSKLQKEEIYCPIHWTLPVEVDKEKYSESCHLSMRTLTIPLIDIDDVKFKYLLSCLNKMDVI